ncbi:uncharacterized protein METZ01_LOCUS62001 [marine metagenome]|uniref:Uncharacterized protein n=1 Tax=marine metagenome TaxID=408172 RepID=A0A381T3G6_9ZZZZ
MPDPAADQEGVSRRDSRCDVPNPSAHRARQRAEVHVQHLLTDAGSDRRL